MEKEVGEAGHRERFDQPVDAQCEIKSLGVRVNGFDRLEIYLNHHWVDHDPYE